MSEDSVRAILGRWLSDDDFRTEMFWNAEATIHRTHLDLDWDEFIELKGVNWRMPAEELEQVVRSMATSRGGVPSGEGGVP